MSVESNEDRIAVMLANINEVLILLDAWLEVGEIVDDDILKRKMGVLISTIGMAGLIRIYNDERENWLGVKQAFSSWDMMATTDSMAMLGIKDLLLKFKWNVSAKYN